MYDIYTNQNTKDTIQNLKYTKYQIRCPKRQIHQDKQPATVPWCFPIQLQLTKYVAT